ncbi:N-acetylmuramidase/lysin [uncultured Mediterranean phage uvMED]|nr:N-acetylmuramidase/lysin [uncultured Mediterranean phage uvMED]
MFALVQDNAFVKIVNSSKGITIGDNQYPKTIFSLWSNAEREAIGIYEISIDSSNKQDEYYYINTDLTYTYADNTVTGSYGTATPKRLEDENAVDEDGNPVLDHNGNQVINIGLKTQEINKIKAQASGLLSPTDWHVVKATEVADYSVPTDVATYRTNVRAKSNEMETQINACSDVDALKTLFTWVYDEDTNTTSRPLASFPEVI